MIWICNELNLETKRYKFDFIFIDEAQDSSNYATKSNKEMLSSWDSFIAIGDKLQCINALLVQIMKHLVNFKKNQIRLL